MKKVSLSFIIIFVFTISINSTIINVPADQPTIQAGIDTSVNGDTVLVAAGTYTGDGNRNIKFNRKNIVLMSTNGPDFTIIDCQGHFENLQRGFIFQNEETELAILDGFTIRNAYYNESGGAIDIGVAYTKPTIQNCIIEDCYANIGGGMFVHHGASVILENCIFRNNTSNGAGAIYMSNEMGMNAEINNCVIENNQANSSGGAIGLYFSRPTISNSTFIGNTAEGSGGAIIGTVASASFYNCTFTQNTAVESGGALSLFESHIGIDQCLFNSNSAAKGGVMYWIFPDVLTATESQQQELNKSILALPEFKNSTFVNNTAFESGSVLYTAYMSTGMVHFGSVFTISNSILAFNNGLFPIDAQDNVFVPQLSCTDIYGNENGDWIGTIADQADTNGNFSSNPIFCDTSSNNFYLQSNSNCLPQNNPCSNLIGVFGEGCSCCVGNRGNVNSDNFDQIDISDLVYLVAFMFQEGAEPLCMDEANFNGSTVNEPVDISDLVALVAYMFQSGNAPADCP